LCDAYRDVVERIETGEECEIFGGGEFVVEKRVVSDEAEEAARFLGRERSSGGEERESAGRGAHELGGDAKKGGLPCSIVPEEGDEFAGSDVEGQAAKSGEGAEAFGNIFKANAER
jgi:hypothetical protein